MSCFREDLGLKVGDPWPGSLRQQSPSRYKDEAGSTVAWQCILEVEMDDHSTIVP